MSTEDYESVKDFIVKLDAGDLDGNLIRKPLGLRMNSGTN